METSSKPVAELIRFLNGPNQESIDAVLPVVYGELHALAERYLAMERQNHTLQPTALVHEAYLRLVGLQSVSWQNRAHFVALAARVMRQVLIGHARSRQALKRGGGRVPFSLESSLAICDEPAIDVIALDEALSKLNELDPRQSRIVELRFFGGLTIEETARVIEMSHATVEREWAVAKAWLQRELSKN